MNLPQRPALKKALWENKAQAARTHSIPNLSRVLGINVSANDFTALAEFDEHMERCRNIKLHEQRFSLAQRKKVLSVLEKIRALNRPTEALLFFARSSVIGGLRVQSTPSAETVIRLLHWDKDDVFVFTPSGELIVHVDLSEDWLKPEDMGISLRKMLYIVSTPINQSPPKS
jgi:hypothetical protein